MGHYLNIAKRIIEQEPAEKKAAYPTPKTGNQKVQLLNEGCRVDGHVVQLYSMRVTCQSAEHCLQHTKEIDCDRYPVCLGVCRGRILTRST